MSKSVAKAIMDRKRNEQGRFVNQSNLGKTFGVRLPKDVEERLTAIAEDENVPPTLLIREIVCQWMEERDRPSKKRKGSA